MYMASDGYLTRIIFYNAERKANQPFSSFWPFGVSVQSPASDYLVTILESVVLFSEIH